MPDISLSTSAGERVSAGFANLIAAFDRCADDVKLQCAEATIEGKFDRSGTLLEASKTMQAFRKEVEDLSRRWSKGMLRSPKSRSPAKIPTPIREMRENIAKNTQQHKSRTRTSSPRPGNWLRNVPELSALEYTASWKDICDHLGIEVTGDSARRRLKVWARDNDKKWPDIPEPS